MEPIGTITSYFPFIDVEIKNVLEGLMKKASDYYDFVHRLCENVLSTESPIMVVYFAVHHAILASDFKLIDMIREKYGDSQILGPNLFFASAYQGAVEDIEKVHELADANLGAQLEDWIQLEMYFLKFEVDMRNYPTTMYQTSTMNRICELIDSNPNFGFYETILNDYLAIRAHADGDNEGRIRCINAGLRIAEKFDDRVRVVHLMMMKASIVMDYDRKEARALLEHAYKIVDSSLGIPVFFAEIIYGLSVLDAIRGDFDGAVKRSLQVVTIRERAGLNTGNASLLLSVLYNQIGEFESALDWGLMAEDQFRSRPSLINRALLNQIWSLVLLKKLTEAQILLDNSRESILKSGDESQLAWLYFVTGIMEMEQCDFSLASTSIEQALSIYEKQGWAYNIQLMFLFHLAKTEVYSSDPSNIVAPSLAILEDKAIAENLPGILGLVLLLKADIANLSNDESLLREIIQQLQTLSEKENLQFLEPYFDGLLGRL